MIAPSSEIWGKCLYSKYKTTGGSGEVGDWNQRLCIMEMMHSALVMLIWVLLIPATRGHSFQSKVLAKITDCSATL